MLRVALSPTGDMHIESLRVAIVNYLVAQQLNVGFLIRIEDIDQASNIEGKDTEFLQILEKFALKHDRAIHQSENVHIHQTLAIRLLEEGKAFVCTCSPKELEGERYSGKCFNRSKEELAQIKQSATPFVLRMKKPEANITYHDLIQGDMAATPDEVDSFVILDAGGLPTYNFSCACDDMLCGVTTIIEEEKHLPDTPIQIHIKSQLGYEANTSYAHLPSMLNQQGEKISSSDKESSIQFLFEEGFVPDAIINYLLLTGNEKIGEEIFTLPEAIESFDLNNLSTSPDTFDLDTLRTINKKHLERMDDRDLSTLFGFADADIGKLAKLYLEEVSTTKELNSKIKAIFNPKNFEGVHAEQMRSLESIVQDAPMFSKFNDFKSHVRKESGLNYENISKPLRLLLTGTENGPELSDIYPFIKSYLLEIAS